MTGSTILDANSYQSGDDPAPEHALIERRTRALGPSYRLFYRNPVKLVRGQGVHLYDAEGREYLDVYNNVASIGHCHPAVSEAIARQAATLNTHTRYLSDDIVEYAERLIATLPSAIDQVMFACTGSEANDLALRVAARYTGGSGVIVTEEAYHGNTALVSAVSPSIGTGVGDEVWTVPAPDSYRCDDPARLGRRFAEDVRNALGEMEAAGVRMSALLLDSIFSSDGIYADPAGFLAEAVDIVRAAGGVLIADEVQPGFGRTGAGLWGFERHGVVPELVTMGKPMGNGFPISALAAQSQVLSEFATSTPYFNTFGGANVAISAAAAVLDVIEGEQLVSRAAEVGAYFRQLLTEWARSRSCIGDVRGAGLFTGLELVSDAERKAPDGRLAADVVNALRERRVLTSVCGPAGNVLKLRPPLVFSRADADRFLDVLDTVFREDLPPRTGE